MREKHARWISHTVNSMQDSRLVEHQAISSQQDAFSHGPPIPKRLLNSVISQQNSEQRQLSSQPTVEVLYRIPDAVLLGPLLYPWPV